MADLNAGLLNPNIVMGSTNPVDQMSKIANYQSQQMSNQAQKQQYNDQLANRNALDNATSVNPDGSVSTDYNKMISELGKTAPHLVPGAKAAQMQMQQAAQDFQMKQIQDHLLLGAQTMASIQDQNTLDQAKTVAVQNGRSVDSWPTKFDPATTPQWAQSAAKNAAYAAMSPDQRITSQISQQKADTEMLGEKNKEQQLKMEYFKTFGNPTTGQGGTAGKVTPDTDPATLIPKHVPPDRQAEAFKETGELQNLAKNSPNIFGAFDRAAKNIHATDIVPGTQNADQKELHALLGPTFKDVEGTVRQAAMDNMFKNTTPAFGDDKATLATKREALAQYIQSKSSAPTAKGYGIDLSQFNSTKIDPKLLVNPYGTPGGQKGPTVGSIIAGHKYLGGDPNNQNSWTPLAAGK